MPWRADRRASPGLALGAALAVAPSCATAQDLAAALAPPEDAVLTHESAEDPAVFPLPVRVAGEEAAPTEPVIGAVSRSAFRIEGGAGTLELLRRYETALGALGFETVLRCWAETCGGFAFRAAIETLPQPAMAVNLADFRQLTMRRAEADGATAASLLFSRFGETTLGQIVTVEGASPAPVVSAPPAEGVPAEAPGETEPAPADGRRPEATPPPGAGAEAAGENAADGGDALAARPGRAETATPEGLLAALRAQGHIALDGVAFAPGSTAFTPGSVPVLDRAAAALAAAPAVSVIVVGHTDATGSLAVNRRISASRARAVVDALASRGIAPARLEAEGVGFLAPRASNATEAGRARNRRVELVLR